MPRRRTCGDWLMMSTPLISIRPEVGSMSRLIIRSVVVLPHPDGPSSAMIDPSSMSSERFVDRGAVIAPLNRLRDLDQSDGVRRHSTTSHSTPSGVSRTSIPALMSSSRMASETAKAFSVRATTLAASAASTTGTEHLADIANALGRGGAQADDHRSECRSGPVDVVGLQRVARPVDDR